MMVLFELPLELLAPSNSYVGSASGSRTCGELRRRDRGIQGGLNNQWRSLKNDMRARWAWKCLVTYPLRGARWVCSNVDTRHYCGRISSTSTTRTITRFGLSNTNPSSNTRTLNPMVSCSTRQYIWSWNWSRDWTWYWSRSLPST